MFILSQNATSKRGRFFLRVIDNDFYAPHIVCEIFLNKTRTQNIHPLQIQVWPFLSVNDHVCVIRGLCFQNR